MTDNFFNESVSFNCGSRPGHGQNDSLYQLYGLNIKLQHSHGNMQNLSMNDESSHWKKNFENLNSGHFVYGLSAILLHFLPTLYTVKIQSTYFHSTYFHYLTELEKTKKNNYDEKTDGQYHWNVEVIEKARKAFNFPQVITEYDKHVDLFFEDIKHYIEKAAEKDEFYKAILKLHNNQEIIRKSHKKFVFLFDKKKREKGDQKDQKEIYSYIDQNQLITYVKEYMKKTDSVLNADELITYLIQDTKGRDSFLSSDDYKHMTEKVWELFEEIKKLPDLDDQKFDIETLKLMLSSYKKEISCGFVLFFLAALYWKKERLLLQLQQLGFGHVYLTNNQKKG